MTNNEGDSKEDYKKIWQEDAPGKNENIPQIAKKLKPAKKKQRVYYAYTYDNKTGESGSVDEPKKSIVVRKRVEAR